MLLPLPFHSCLLSFCHIFLPLYAVDLPISHSLWRALGVTHTFLVHLIAEFSEQGCTNTLYFHGFSHVWFGDRLPIQFGDEAGEADLRMAKRFAPVTSTEPTASKLRTVGGMSCTRSFARPRPRGGVLHFGALYGGL